MKGLKKLLFLGLTVLFGTVSGQTISSTYSDNGIGLIHYQGLPNNMAMGEVGIGVPTTWHLNFQNPAFLPYNRYSVFQVGMEMDRRNMESSIINGSKVSGGLRFLNYAFPVINGKWTTSMGLSPYSTSNLDKFSRETVQDTVVRVTAFNNSGGLSAFHWANGFTLADGLYAGARVTYLFGTLSYLEQHRLDNSSSLTSRVDDNRSYSGSKFDISMGYVAKPNDDTRLSFGAVYSLSSNLTGERVSQISTRSSSTEPSNVDISYRIPSSLGLGISYHNIDKLILGFDVKTTQWASAGESGDQFVNTTKIGFGVQWTPDYASLNSFWKRIDYRLGITFDKLPYVFNGNEINETGVTFGGSIPMGVSNLDLAFKYGVLGTLDNDLIREDYFRIVIGATINDRWFIKRRYD